MEHYILKLINNNSGATAIEYAIIAGLLSATLAGGLTLVGKRLSTGFSDVSVKVSNSVESGLGGSSIPESGPSAPTAPSAPPKAYEAAVPVPVKPEVIVE